MQEFMDKDFPRAAEKAQYHLNKAIGAAKNAGAKPLLGQSYQKLGLLHSAEGRIDPARDCFSRAIQTFEECETEVYLKASRKALYNLQ
jgi:tetratricopeptide (TPR) repeat protein